MSESGEAPTKKGSDPPPVQAVRTEEPKAPFGQDEPNPDVVSDATAEEKGGGDVNPPLGGYQHRDPETEMPVVPSAPETAGGTAEHGGEPKTDQEPPASN